MPGATAGRALAARPQGTARRESNASAPIGRHPGPSRACYLHLGGRSSSISVRRTADLRSIPNGDRLPASAEECTHPHFPWLILCCPASPLTRGPWPMPPSSRRCPEGITLHQRHARRDCGIAGRCSWRCSPGPRRRLSRRLREGAARSGFLPLWDMPNVLISPHTANNSLGLERGDLRHLPRQSAPLPRRPGAAQRRR